MSKITRVGVVRWDACGDLTTFFGASAYRTLRNPKYRGRLPFYTKFMGEGALSEFDFPTDPAEYADEETRLAKTTPRITSIGEKNITASFSIPAIPSAISPAKS